MQRQFPPPTFSVNATLVRREERVAAQHHSAAIRTLTEQVEHSVRQRLIAANLDGSQKRNPISAVSTCDVVLNRDSREEEGPIIIDLHAITSVSIDNVVSYHCLVGQAHVCVVYDDTGTVAAYVIPRNCAGVDVYHRYAHTVSPKS